MNFHYESGIGNWSYSVVGITGVGRHLVPRNVDELQVLSANRCHWVKFKKWITNRG